MRHLQVGLVHHLIPRQNQIEIERPRRARVRARPAGRRLDRAQRLEQLSRRQARLPHPDRVQVRRIVLEPVPDRLRFR